MRIGVTNEFRVLHEEYPGRVLFVRGIVEIQAKDADAVAAVLTPGQTTAGTATVTSLSAQSESHRKLGALGASHPIIPPDYLAVDQAAYHQSTPV